MVGVRCEVVLEITISIQFRVSNHSHPPRRKQFFINRDRNRPRPVQSVASLARLRFDEAIQLRDRSPPRRSLASTMSRTIQVRPNLALRSNLMIHVSCFTA